MFERIASSFQYFDCMMPIFLAICGIFSDDPPMQFVRCTNFPGIHGVFMDVDRMLLWIGLHFLRVSWDFHGCLTDFLGSSSILIARCQFFLGVRGIVSDDPPARFVRCTNFLGIHGTFTGVDRTLLWIVLHFLRISLGF